MRYDYLEKYSNDFGDNGFHAETRNDKVFIVDITATVLILLV